MGINENPEDEIIRKKLKTLDNSFPEALGRPEELWEDISGRLETGTKKTLIKYILAVAASISLLVVGYVLLVHQPNREEMITYKTEVVQEDEKTEPFIESGREGEEAMEFVNAQCSMQKPACNTEEFLMLKKQLEEVDVEINEISQQLELFGPDPALVRAYTYAENQKAYLLRELIQILIS